MTLDRENVHARELLLLGRCPACAELIPALVVLRGESCDHCATPARVDARHEEALTEALSARWARRSWIAVGIVGMASLLGGFVPFVQAPILLVGTLLAQVWVIGDAIGWLSPLRGAFTRLTLNLLLAALGVADLAANALVAGIPLLSAPILGLLGAATLWLYLAAARTLIRARLARDREGAPLGVTEWGVPVALLLTLVGVVLGAVALAWAVIQAGEALLGGIVHALGGVLP